MNEEEERGEGCESGGEEDVKGKGDKRTLLVCAICTFQFSYIHVHVHASTVHVKR